MEFRDYQQYALRTDQVPGTDGAGIIVPLLGLAGEAGELLSEYKKHLREGEAYRLFKERVAEELRDLLWYLSNAASKFGLDLDDIAVSNLAKCRDRWGRDWQATQRGATAFDASYPESERLPRRFEVEITEVREGTSVKMRAYIAGEQYGDDLTDNAYDLDGYRFHDVFHFAFAAVLGWSPVTRALLKRKRKSDPRVDEVEDGGRAIVIEEGLVALIFDYAKAHAFLNGVAALDYRLLQTIRGVTSHLEVRRCTIGDWEAAVFRGFEVWRQVMKNGGGWIETDLDARSIGFRPSGGSSKSTAETPD